jgi:TRAP-type transport system periplasmic protein
MLQHGNHQAKMEEFKVKRLTTIFAAGTMFLAAAGIASAADFNWRYVGVINSAHDYAKLMIEGFERVEERTDGSLNIDYVSYGETPYNPVDALTLLRDGLVEMSEWLPGYNAATYPLLAAPELPLITPQWEDPASLQESTIEAWATPTVSAYKTEILDEHNSESLMTIFYDPINIWFSEIVTDLDGIAGKKVRATSPEQAEWLTSLGASPVNISAGDAYTGLQRGVIDGIITGAGAVVSFKWDEVLKSGFATNVVLSSTNMLINKDALDSLPEETRNILVEEMEKVEAAIHELMPQAYEEKIAELREKGVTITEPTPELYQEFRQRAVENVYPSWAERAGGEAETVLSEMGVDLD